MKNENQIVYKSFKEAYKEIEKMQTLKILDMTPEENFNILDLEDLELNKRNLTVLEKLNFHDNLVSKLKLKNFPSLTSINGSNNTISEVNLNLKRLTHLDLSHNMISKFFDLSELPSLTYFNISYNLINEINILHILPLHKTLKELFLDFNVIDFKSSNDFISFIEGMKGIYYLEHLKLEGNIFIRSRQELTKNYKILISAMLPQLNKLNGETFSLNRTALNKDQIITQILRDEKDINYGRIKKNKATEDKKEFEDPKILENSELNNETKIINAPATTVNQFKKNFTNFFANLLNLNAYQDKNKSKKILQKLSFKDFLRNSLILPFKKINRILNELVESMGRNQLLCMKFINEVKSLLTTNLTNMQIRYANRKEFAQIIDKEFRLFLINSQILLEIDVEYEEIIYKSVAQFALFAKGKLFVEKVFDFFSTLIKASTFKNELIKNIIEDVIIKRIKEREELPMNILIELLKFFKSSKIRCDSFYLDLIDRVFATYEGIIDEIQDCFNTLFEDEAVIKNYEGCVEFFKKFLDLGKEIKIKIDSTETNLIRQNLCFNKEFENKDEYKYLNLGRSIEDSYSSEVFDSDFDEDGEIEINRIKKLYESDSDSNSEENFNIKNEKISSAENIKHISEIFQLKEGIGFLNFFDKVYSSSLFVLSKVETILRLDNYYTLWDMFHLTLELIMFLSKNFENLCIKYKISKIDKEKLRLEINSKNKIYIKNLEKYTKQILIEYLKDINHFDLSLETNVIGLIKKNSFENKYIIQKYKTIFHSLLICLGCILRLEINSEYLESDLSFSILEILNSTSNDQYMLTGAIKFLLQIISNDHQDRLIFKNIMTRVKFFSILLRYLNNEDICYKNLIDKICEENSENKRFTVKNNSLKSFYSLENLKSRQMQKLFSTFLKIYRNISYLSVVENPIKTVSIQTIENLKDLHVLELISNCLKIPNDKLKKCAVECLYYTDKKYITSQVVSQILKIITSFESITKGETEIIFSVVYIITTNLLHFQKMKEINDSIQLTSLDIIHFNKFLTNSFDILSKNLDRDPNDIIEIKQKNILSMSILLYLNQITKYKEIFQKVLNEGIQDNFRTLIYYEYTYFDSSNYIPLELERTFLGNFLSILFEVTQTKEAIQPYSYPFLRILMKIADNLCYVDDFSYHIDFSKDYHNLFIKLQQEIQMRTRHKIINEKLSWDLFNLHLSDWIENDCNNVNGYLELYLNNAITFDEDFTDWIFFDFDNFHFDYFAKKIEFKDSPSVFMFKKNEFNEEKIPKDNSKTENENNFTTIDNKKNQNSAHSTIESTIFSKQSLEILVEDHIDFLAFFPNIFNYITGQSSNMLITNIYKNLKKKFDKRIEKSDEIFSIIEIINQNSILLTSNKETSQSQSENKNEEDAEENEIEKSQKHNSTIEKYLNLNLNSRKTSAIKQIPNPTNYMKFMSLIMASTNKYLFNKTQKLSNENEDHFINDFKEDTYNKYGLNSYHRRISEEETVDNPHLRSLIISSLLRCIYAILISPCKKVSQDFVEILFIETFWKDLILFIGTGKNFEYSIINKSLTIFQEIFKKNNLEQFCIILNKMHIKQIEEDSSKNLTILIKTEKKIFHFYYIFILYFEKMLNDYYINYFHPEIDDIYLLKNIILTFFSFLSNFSEISFQMIEKRFIEKYVYEKLANKKFLEIIFFGLKSFCYLRKKVMKKLREVSSENIQFKFSKLVYDKMELESKFNLIDDETINHLILFAYDVEVTISKIEELLALIMSNYPDAEVNIFEKISEIFETGENEFYKIEKFSENLILFLINENICQDNEFIIKENSKKDEKLIIDKNIFLRKREEFMEYKKLFLEYFALNQKIIFYSNSITQILSDDNSDNLSNSNLNYKIEFKIFSEICEFQLLQTSKKILTFCYVNKNEFFLFKISDYHLSEFPQKKITESLLKTVRTPILKIKLEEIKKIFYFDYHNRILIKSKLKEFSLIFKSTDKARRLVENIQYYNAKLQIQNLNFIRQEISKEEKEDEYIKKNLKERNEFIDRIQRTNETSEKREFIKMKTENELKNKRKRLDKIKAEFRLGNSIWNNFYTNDFFFSRFDSFIVKFDNNNFFEDSKKILFVSDFYFYVLKEDFERFDLKEYDIADDYYLKEKAKSIYKTYIQIKLEDILSIQKSSNLGLKLIYGNGRNQHYTFYFYGFFEFFLFLYKIDRAIRYLMIESNSKNIK